MPETIWKKSQTKLFIDFAGGTTAAWTRIGKSVVFDLAMNAQTESYDFIQNDMPTEIIDYYKPELPIEHIAAAGDDGFDGLWDIYEALSVGNDAIKKALIVFPKAAATSGSFRAWMMDATIVFTNLTTTEKKLKLTLYFGGTVAHGSVAFDGTTGAPTFTEDT